MTEKTLSRIRRLVGAVSPEQLRFVECFVAERIALLAPSVGPCFYAVTPDHSHPGYSFFLALDDQARLCTGDRGITSTPGRVLAVDPEVMHHELATEEPHRHIGF